MSRQTVQYSSKRMRVAYTRIRPTNVVQRDVWIECRTHGERRQSSLLYDDPNATGSEHRLNDVDIDRDTFIEGLDGWAAATWRFAARLMWDQHLKVQVQDKAIPSSNNQPTDQPSVPLASASASASKPPVAIDDGVIVKKELSPDSGNGSKARPFVLDNEDDLPSTEPHKLISPERHVVINQEESFDARRSSGADRRSASPVMESSMADLFASIKHLRDRKT